MANYEQLAQTRMEKVIDSYQHALSNIRTGRANPGIISEIEVDYYGAPTPLNQMGQISVVEGTQLVVKLYDTSMLKEVEKAINSANIGLVPQNDGSVIRLNVPKLTEETRKDLSKGVSKFAEEAKISIRNIRRDLNDEAKCDDELNEDGEKHMLELIQKQTDAFIKRIDGIGEDKVKEIMTI